MSRSGQSLLCDGQGIVRQAILYTDKSYISHTLIEQKKLSKLQDEITRVIKLMDKIEERLSAGKTTRPNKA